ncbi:MAG: ArsR/SmtB family transcription factor [Thermoleophilaceae bacterium]|jgi:DNA-binding transcriptional ArsR family regulator
MRSVRHPHPREIEVTDVLHALSDPVRLQIVRHLALCDERCCNALEAQVSKSTLSHHLKVLREAGLTRTRVSGTQRLVSLRDEELEQCMPGLLRSVLDAAAAAAPQVHAPALRT